MVAQVRAELRAEGVAAARHQDRAFEIDVRYSGQAFEVPMYSRRRDSDEARHDLVERFDDEHRRLFTFNMDGAHELVNLRASRWARLLDCQRRAYAEGRRRPRSAAKLRDHEVWMDGARAGRP